MAPRTAGDVGPPPSSLKVFKEVDVASMVSNDLVGREAVAISEGTGSSGFVSPVSSEGHGSPGWSMKELFRAKRRWVWRVLELFGLMAPTMPLSMQDPGMLQ